MLLILIIIAATISPKLVNGRSVLSTVIPPVPIPRGHPYTQEPSFSVHTCAGPLSTKIPMIGHFNLSESSEKNNENFVPYMVRHMVSLRLLTRSSSLRGEAVDGSLDDTRPPSLVLVGVSVQGIFALCSMAKRFDVIIIDEDPAKVHQVAAAAWMMALKYQGNSGRLIRAFASRVGSELGCPSNAPCHAFLPLHRWGNAIAQSVAPARTGKLGLGSKLQANFSTILYTVLDAPMETYRLWEKGGPCTGHFLLSHHVEGAAKVPKELREVSRLGYCTIDLTAAKKLMGPQLTQYMLMQDYCDLSVLPVFWPQSSSRGVFFFFPGARLVQCLGRIATGSVPSLSKAKSQLDVLRRGLRDQEGGSQKVDIDREHVEDPPHTDSSGVRHTKKVRKRIQKRVRVHLSRSSAHQRIHQ